MPGEQLHVVRLVPISDLSKIDVSVPRGLAVYGTITPESAIDIYGIDDWQFRPVTLKGVAMRFLPFGGINNLARNILYESWPKGDFLGGFTLVPSRQDEVDVQVGMLVGDQLTRALARAAFWNLYGIFYGLTDVENQEGMPLFTETLVKPEGNFRFVAPGFLESPKVREHQAKSWALAIEQREMLERQYPLKRIQD